HFLHSPHVIKSITEDRPENCDAIIEVGPGPAVLTPYLVKHGLPVYAFEMDKRFKEILEGVIPHDHLVMADALTVDWNEFLLERGHKRAWLVSNLPYNISVPLTLSFMKCSSIIQMTLMYQKEVAEKFLPKPGKNTMSSLHALAEIFFKTSRLCDVPPGAFQPPPKVMSQVLSFKRKIESTLPLEEWSSIELFFRLMFQNRRKQLKGILKERMGEESLKTLFAELKVPESVRAEALTFEQVIKLYQLDQRLRIN
ncbi:MAG: 16S rRNA (adenine(1518)-N(6)/adenine(1519)-N(6))-dimethyltransferase RsmA, partial [Bacteriovoracaceae bacterium]|nr:16S rRNA (adenine(1518)-N(6)/adenine(1519)-N(6))-dimethyltransferase RsmA [Bacteriovoracaceae bacterium]